MTIISVTYSVDLDGHVYVEDVPCAFDLDVETCPAEPYSWGGSRGMETSVSAKLTGVTLGGLTLTRDQAVLMFGADAVSRAERAAEDRAAEAEEIAA